MKYLTLRFHPAQREDTESDHSIQKGQSESQLGLNGRSWHACESCASLMEWVKFHLLCALIVPFAVAEGEENIDMAEEENVLKWQRWIGNLRKEYKGQKRKEKRMRHEMAGRTNRGRIWSCTNIVYSFTTLQLLIQSKISTWNILMSVYLNRFMYSQL